jgi:hypothetical protein
MKTNNKMGNNSSRQIKKDKLKKEAMEKLNMRINSYDYQVHGNHFEYINWCRAQYQLDCITKVSSKFKL